MNYTNTYLDYAQERAHIAFVTLYLGLWALNFPIVWCWKHDLYLFVVIVWIMTIRAFLTTFNHLHKPVPWRSNWRFFSILWTCWGLRRRLSRPPTMSDRITESITLYNEGDLEPQEFRRDQVRRVPVKWQQEIDRGWEDVVNKFGKYIQKYEQEYLILTSLLFLNSLFSKETTELIYHCNIVWLLLSHNFVW